MRAGTLVRGAATAAAAWGALLVVLSAVALPDAMAAQHLVDGARPLVQPARLAQQRAIVAQGQLGLDEVLDTALPRLADRLGETPADLQAELQSRYPTVWTALTRMPAILATTDRSLASLQRHHADFVDADSFPAPGLSPPATAGLGIGLGLVLLALGVATLRSRRPARPLAGVLVVALACLVLPLAGSAPDNAQGVHAMVASLNLNQQTATQTRAALTTVEQLHDGLEQQVLPDAARRIGIDTAGLRSDIEAGLSALPAFEQSYRAILALFRPDVELREAAVADFQRIRGVPVVEVAWTFIALSGALAVLAAAGLLGTLVRRRSLPV